MNLKNKIALVTGGTSGIGRATAILFAKNGYKVIINGRDERRGLEVAKEIDGIFIKADVSNEEEIKNMFSQIKSLDVLINNAGAVIDNDNLYKAGRQELEANFAINFYSVFYCTQQAIKIMLSGAIVNVGSGCGRDETPVGESELVPIYSATKAAIHNFSQNCAKILAPKIRVNTVVPGYTKTPIWGEDFSKKEEERLIKQTRIGRFCNPEEVAEVIYLLATNEAMTGSQIVIDGGILLK